MSRGEEVVQQDELLRPVPVVREIFGEELGVGAVVRGLALVEPVHPALVPGLDGSVVAVLDVRRKRTASCGCERPLHAAVHPHRDAARAAEPAEHVIEGPVLLDDVDDALDRRQRSNPVASTGSGAVPIGIGGSQVG